MHILGFIFIVFIIIFVIGISLICSIIRALFGVRRKGNNNQQRSSGGYGNTGQQRQNTGHSYTNQSNGSTITIFDTNVKPRKKIFSSDEGEYTDYEVIV